MRIASNTVSDSIVRQIQRLGAQQAKLQTQVGTGQRITNPEDDPAGVARVLNLNSEQRSLAQFVRNADRAMEVSQASYSGLQQIKKVSDRATEIGTLGAGVNSADAARAYASELSQLIEQTLQLANSRLGNDYLYAGTAVDQPPFVATRDADGRITSVAYAGNDERAEIALSENSGVTAQTSGETNRRLGDFLNHLVALRDALTANDPNAVTSAQTALLSDEDVLVSALAEHGGVQARIEATQAQQKDRATSLESLVSAEADQDIPSAIVKLNQAQTAYQAALQSAANIMRLSLLDYLK